MFALVTRVFYAPRNFMETPQGRAHFASESARIIAELRPMINVFIESHMLVEYDDDIITFTWTAYLADLLKLAG